VSTIEPDPWGAYTSRYSNGAFQPREFSSYERDANRSDEAMFRRYNRWQSRFDQPDPTTAAPITLLLILTISEGQKALQILRNEDFKTAEVDLSS
jgi:hypothetical protein